MGKAKKILISLLFILPVGKALAQTEKIPSIVMEIQKQLMSQEAIGYEYKVDQTLPDGTKNSLKGKLFKTKNYLEETNAGELVLQTDEWYYKADHINKKVFLLNAHKLNKLVKMKGGSLNTMSVIPDSILEKHGKIDVKQSGDIIKVTIEFGPQVLIRQLYLEYNTRRKLPVIYRVKMDMLYSIDGGNYEERYMSQTMTATNFSFKAGQKLLTDDYFTVSGGKVKLKKYNSYKIIENL